MGETPPPPGAAVLDREVTSSLPSSQVERATPVTVPRVLDDVSKLRLALGFPEQPLPPAVDRQTEKEALIEEYIRGREREIFSQPEVGFIDRDKKEVEEEIAKAQQKASEAKSVSYRFNRAVTIKLMQARGIKNVDEVIASIEQRIPHPYFPDLRSFTAIDGLKKIGNVGLAIDRVHRLGYHGVGVAIGKRDFLDALHVLEEVPEETFEKICQDLNKYFF